MTNDEASGDATNNVGESGEFVTGAALLTSIFGHWPSFHDAEVIWVRLQREGVNGLAGPTIEALIHTWEMTTEVDPTGYYVGRNHVLVHFRFEEVDENELHDFNAQNVLFGLDFSSTSETDGESVCRIIFQSSFGLSGVIRCRQVTVLSVTTCDSTGMPLTTDA